MPNVGSVRNLKLTFLEVNIRMSFYGVMTSSHDQLKSMCKKSVVDAICETISMSKDTIYELEFDDSCMRECDRGETICTSTLSTIKTFKKTRQDSISVYYSKCCRLVD